MLRAEHLDSMRSAATRTLNLLPSMLFFSAVLSTYILAICFLEYYVIAGKGACLCIFIIGSYVIGSSYCVCDFVMQRKSTSYVSIPDDKKFYALSNLIKSATLVSYVPFAAHTLWQCTIDDVWDTARIHRLSVLYCIPDFVSLFLVRRMTKPTVVHHLFVVIFTVVNVHNDYNDDNACRGVVVYACFSTFAYLVNLLLASRFLNATSQYAAHLSLLATCIYVFCLGLNWTWQLWYVSNRFAATPRTCVAYMCALLMVVYDDVVLCRWLCNNTRRLRQPMHLKDA